MFHLSCACVLNIFKSVFTQANNNSWFDNINQPSKKRSITSKPITGEIPAAPFGSTAQDKVCEEQVLAFLSYVIAKNGKQFAQIPIGRAAPIELIVFTQAAVYISDILHDLACCIREPPILTNQHD